MACKRERAGKIVLPIRVARVARTVLLISLAVALLGIVQLAEARITRIVITSTQSPAFGGASSMTVSQMLAYAASQSNVGGSMWYGNVKATQVL